MEAGADHECRGTQDRLENTGISIRKARNLLRESIVDETDDAAILFGVVKHEGRLETELLHCDQRLMDELEVRLPLPLIEHSIVRNDGDKPAGQRQVRPTNRRDVYGEIGIQSKPRMVYEFLNRSVGLAIPCTNELRASKEQSTLFGNGRLVKGP